MTLADEETPRVPVIFFFSDCKILSSWDRVTAGVSVFNLIYRFYWMSLGDLLDEIVS